MISPADVADLYNEMPDPQTVSYTKRSGTTWAAAQTVYNCEKRWPTRKEMASIQSFVADTQVIIWHMWKAKLNGLTPRTGDKFTHSGTTWFVKQATQELLGERWRLVCTEGR